MKNATVHRHHPKITCPPPPTTHTHTHTHTGMNLFLKNLDITFRRDPTNYRPRINKKASARGGVVGRGAFPRWWHASTHHPPSRSPTRAQESTKDREQKLAGTYYYLED